MTRRTVVSERVRRMIRRLRRREIRLMAGITVHRRSYETGVRMARRTVDGPVSSLKRKHCLRMIERRSAPAVHCVTGDAVVRELRTLVIRSSGSRKIRTVTAEAIGRRASESGILMTRGAVHREV